VQLEVETRPEPLPWSRFFIARCRALIAGEIIMMRRYGCTALRRVLAQLAPSGQWATSPCGHEHHVCHRVHDRAEAGSIFEVKTH
jgi:hypothetical protein